MGKKDNSEAYTKRSSPSPLKTTWRLQSPTTDHFQSEMSTKIGAASGDSDATDEFGSCSLVESVKGEVKAVKDDIASVKQVVEDRIQQVLEEVTSIRYMMKEF